MLSVRDLCRPGLGPVSFDLAGGECLAVRGPSGAGKTLLLRAVADLDPNDGTVTLDGRDRAAMPAPRWRRMVTFVPADPGWWDDAVGAHFADWAAAAPLAESLGLPTACRDWSIQRLSTGERQRLGLVRALLLRPRVLLLDEPTSGLDDAATAAVERLIGASRRDGGTGVVWSTHDAAQARRIAGRCLIVDRGSMRIAAA